MSYYCLFVYSDVSDIFYNTWGKSNVLRVTFFIQVQVSLWLSLPLLSHYFLEKKGNKQNDSWKNNYITSVLSVFDWLVHNWTKCQLMYFPNHIHHLGIWQTGLISCLVIRLTACQIVVGVRIVNNYYINQQMKHKTTKPGTF